MEGRLRPLPPLSRNGCPRFLTAAGLEGARTRTKSEAVVGGLESPIRCAKGEHRWFRRPQQREWRRGCCASLTGFL